MRRAGVTRREGINNYLEYKSIDAPDNRLG
jgi:hypothetical protein